MSTTPNSESPTFSAAAENSLADNNTCMGEILPGLWIGSLAAVRHIVGTCCTTDGNIDAISASGSGLVLDQSLVPVRWTIVSLLDSERLIKLSNLLVAQCMNASGSDADTSIIVRHELWKLPDRANSKFLSQRLAEILQVIDEGIPPLTKAMSTEASSSATESPGLDQSSMQPNNSIITVTESSRHVFRHSACLVHCAQGVSRSAAVCAAWSMTRKHLTLQEALAVVRRVRPQIQPNLGFVAGLRAIQQCHGDLDKATARLNGNKNGKNINNNTDEPNQASGCS